VGVDVGVASRIDAAGVSFTAGLAATLAGTAAVLLTALFAALLGATFGVTFDEDRATAVDDDLAAAFDEDSSAAFEEDLGAGFDTDFDLPVEAGFDAAFPEDFARGLREVFDFAPVFGVVFALPLPALVLRAAVAAPFWAGLVALFAGDGFAMGCSRWAPGDLRSSEAPRAVVPRREVRAAPRVSSSAGST
jgi:hypothetical protein